MKIRKKVMSLFGVALIMVCFIASPALAGSRSISGTCAGYSCVGQNTCSSSGGTARTSYETVGTCTVWLDYSFVAVYFDDTAEVIHRTRTLTKTATTAYVSVNKPANDAFGDYYSRETLSKHRVTYNGQVWAPIFWYWSNP